MEQRFATSSVGHKCIGMCAYINRENVFSRYIEVKMMLLIHIF